jgi:hypothetical protein
VAGKNDFKIEADDDAFQIGQMSGGTVHMPRFVAKLGPWGFLAIGVSVVVVAFAAIMIVAIVVVGNETEGEDPGVVATEFPGFAPTQVSGIVPVMDQGSGPAPSIDQPATTSCPFRATAVWLQLADFYYGPFFYTDGVGYFIGFNADTIVAGNTATGIDSTYPHPASFSGLNQWLTLPGNEPVIVCVDTAGNVFADFG